MKDQLLLLLELQQIDSRVREVRASIETLPEKLRPAKQDLAKLESMLDVEKAQLAATEAWRREQEELIAADEEGLKNAKVKISAAKTPRDFAAATREVDNKRRAISEREEEVLKVIEAIEKAQAQIDAHEKDVETLRQHIREQEAQIGESIKKLEVEATEQAAGRSEVTAKVEPKMLRLYEGTLKKKGYALAPVESGTCMACHISLPPQLNNEIARFASLEFCPSCKRLLYRQDFLEVEA